MSTLDSPLARGDILSRTGVSTDVLTFWVRRGLVRPLAREPGRHMRFAYQEANFAAIMLQLRDFGANIEAMQGVAGIYRDAIAWGREADLTFDDAMVLGRYMNGPLAGQTDHFRATGSIDLAVYDRNIAALRAGVDGRFALTDKLLGIAEEMDVSKYELHSAAFGEIMSQPSSLHLPYPTYFWRTSDGWKRGNHQGGQLRASQDGAYATIAIDVAGLLYRIWNRPAARGNDEK